MSSKRAITLWRKPHLAIHWWTGILPTHPFHFILSHWVCNLGVSEYPKGRNERQNQVPLHPSLPGVQQEEAENANQVSVIHASSLMSLSARLELLPGEVYSRSSAAALVRTKGQRSWSTSSWEPRLWEDFLHSGSPNHPGHLQIGNHMVVSLIVLAALALPKDPEALS